MNFSGKTGGNLVATGNNQPEKMAKLRQFSLEILGRSGNKTRDFVIASGNLEQSQAKNFNSSGITPSASESIFWGIFVLAITGAITGNIGRNRFYEVEKSL